MVKRSKLLLKRLKLLRILATMPSEAYGWILIAIAQRIWPDGIGGFQRDSQKSITAARKEATKRMNEGDMQ